MTTIAYRDGKMAGDSKVTYDGSFQGNVTKVFKSSKGDLVGLCGDTSGLPAIKEWVKKGCKTPIPNFDGESSVMWVKPDGTAYIVEFGAACEVEGPFFAIGSGHAFAKGAMGAGCDAETAVAIAVGRPRQGCVNYKHLRFCQLSW
jgi:ATP-dependent protease HslVU (ClpYQ) peptidase subunit